MPENLEIKARIGSVEEAIEIARSLPAEDKGEMRQVDTYFRVPAGRLKLREIDSTGCQLIAYRRSEDSPVRLSRYGICSLPYGTTLSQLLEGSLGLAGRVEKRRRLFLFGSTRIHIDEVALLGTFLELECVLSEGGSRGSEEISFLMGRFGITEKSCIFSSYIDLLPPQEFGES